MTTYRTSSSRETEALGRELALKIIARAGGGRKATTVFLSGDLGAGKTTFVRGFARGLGVRERVQSPTFVFVRRHKVRRGQFKSLFHVDAYRIEHKITAKHVGVLDAYDNPSNILLVEWPARLQSPRIRPSVRIVFSAGKNQTERILKVFGV